MAAVADNPDQHFTDRPGYSFSPGPPPEASAFLKGKSLRPAFSWADVEPEEHAAAFTVAKAMQVDVLETIRADLQRALDEGLPFQTFKRDLTPRLQALGWWGRQEVADPATGELADVQLGSPRRLRTIYQSNIRSARAAGQWARVQRTKRALPFLLYQTGASERHRPEHLAKRGMVLPVDDPFWLQWMPPNGWGCKCWVRQITRREAESRGIADSPPSPLPTTAWTNPRTGEVRQVPVGIDPGWETNPGETRLRYLEQHLAGTLQTADPAIARAAARDMAGSWYARRLLDGGGQGSVPVALLPGDLVEALGARSPVVRYSAKTVAAHEHHPEVGPEVLPLIADLVTDATVIREANTAALQFFGADQLGKLWKLVVKATADGSEVYVVTWHRADAKALRRALRDGTVVREAPGRS